MTIGAQAGVMTDCPDNQTFIGSPATPHRDQMQIMAVQRRLPQMRKEIRDLSREIEQLKQQADSGSINDGDNRQAA